MAINKNNKNFQITLDPDSANILETLAVRFKTSKSIIIRNALKVYAAKKSHCIRINYSTLLEVEQTEQKPSSINESTPLTEEESREWDERMKELESIKPVEDDDPDKLPF